MASQKNQLDTDPPAFRTPVGDRRWAVNLDVWLFRVAVIISALAVSYVVIISVSAWIAK